MEHFARIAYVNLRYSIPNKKIEGWQTDPGKVYIRYGPPENQTRTRAWYNFSFAGGSNPLVSSKEIWKYPGFQFIFEDRFLNRNYQFKWGTTPYDDYLDIYRRIIKQLPENYQPDWGGGKFQIPLVTTQYACPDQLKAIYLFYGVPVRSVNRQISRSKNLAQTQIQKGVFVFTDDWQPIFKNKTDVTMETPLQSDYAENYFLATDSLQLPPASYHLIVEAFEPEGKNFGRYQDTLQVLASKKQSIDLSDLLLAKEIKLKTAIENVNRNRISVIPNFESTFRPGEDLYLYYEIYNLAPDSVQQTNYRIEHTIRQMPEKTALFSTILSTLGLKKQVLTKVVSVYNYSGNRRQENHYRILQLKDYASGFYRLDVNVEDINNRHRAEKTIWFQIQKNKP